MENGEDTEMNVNDIMDFINEISSDEESEVQSIQDESEVQSIPNNEENKMETESAENNNEIIENKKETIKEHGIENSSDGGGNKNKKETIKEHVIENSSDGGKK